MTLDAVELDIKSLRPGYTNGDWTPAEVIREVYRRIRARGNDFVWSELLDERIALDAASRLPPRPDGRLPLYGLPFSVKDNIDVAGMRTSSGCAGFRRFPAGSAYAVLKAQAAGAILIGKNTLDQFATGLNGTRSLGGYCRNVFDERFIPGGSSSGSGVAVAARLVTFSLGSDTGGSGRVPAAMNNIVGVKPTCGLISTRGMVFNNQSFDCMPVFALNVDDGYRVVEAIRGFDAEDDYSRRDAGDIALNAPVLSGFTFAVPNPEQLEFFGDEAAREAFDQAVSLLIRAGGVRRQVDFALFLEAGRIPFASGLLAERLTAYRHVLDESPDTLHPAVKAVLEAGARYCPDDIFSAIYALNRLRRETGHLMKDFDVLVTPTVARAYRCDEMEADPINRNNHMGYYTYCVNPLDLCALALPASIRPDGIPFGISLIAPAGRDAVLRSIGGCFAAAVGLRGGLADRRAAGLGTSPKI